MNKGLKHSKRLQRAIYWFLMLTTLSLLIACGGESGQVKTMGQYEAGSKSKEDVENLFRADSRVDDYEISGETVTVNVNQSFASAPYGMQQRTLWNWYNNWQAANSGSKSSKVIVKSNGTELAQWNHSDGYKPAAPPKTASE